MKKMYVAPKTDALEVVERYGVLEGDISGVASGGDSLSKQSDTIWDDVDDDEGDVTGVSKPKDLWGEDGEATDE